MYGPGTKWNYIPFTPLPKIANCGEVCASQLVLQQQEEQQEQQEEERQEEGIQEIIVKAKW